MKMSKHKDDEIRQFKEELRQKDELLKHYIIYLKSWQKARAMIKDVLEDKSLSKEEKAAINTIFNTMTQALDEVARV